MYLFDTNVSSEITKRNASLVVVRRMMACVPELRFASEITRYELRYGAALLPPTHPLWPRIEAEVLPYFAWLPADREVVLRAANLGARLRLSGKTIDWADLFIAATALVHDLIVVTRNVRHFERIDELQVENWFPAA